MTTYGVRVKMYRVGSEHGHLRAREVEAPDRRTAEQYAAGWLAFEGCDPARSVIDVVTDGMTFAEHMARELTNMSARLSLRCGVNVEGTFQYEDRERPCASVRLYLPNGWGVSVRLSLSDAGFVSTEAMTIREEKEDRHGWVLDDAGLFPYPVPVGVGEEFDGDIIKILDKLTPLVRK